METNHFTLFPLHHHQNDVDAFYLKYNPVKIDHVQIMMDHSNNHVDVPKEKRKKLFID
jgi:hypothetical protein